jgi:GrpB-like predicted nucleotidyltransferase (UPF0157 family)
MVAEGGRLIGLIVEQVHIVSYDLSWPSLFAQERNLVLESVGQRVEEVKHIGSTAIPGLDAKPVIDLMVGLKSMAHASCCVEPLTNLGYSYWAEGAQPHHHLFVRFVDPAMSARTHNLHLVEAGGQYWEERLLFRDYLRKQLPLFRVLPRASNLRNRASGIEASRNLRDFRQKEDRTLTAPVLLAGAISPTSLYPHTSGSLESNGSRNYCRL